MDLDILQTQNNVLPQQYIEYNTYENPHLESRKEDIFKEDAYDENKEIIYGDRLVHAITNETTKSYFKRLYALNIPHEVKLRVEEKIIAFDKRIHQVSDEILCSLVIISYQELGLSFNIELIIRMFNLDPVKSRVTEYISQCTTEVNIMSNQETSINQILIKPSTYICELFKTYITIYNLPFENSDQISNKLFLLTQMLESHIPMISDYSPRETAAVILYLYLKGRINTKRSYYSKKVFSTLPQVENKSFDKSYDFLKTKFEYLKNNHTDYLNQFY